MDVTDDELQDLYMWVDEIPLSRPKRNIARDFADGVLMAEIMHFYFPKLVELHNYSGAHAQAQKIYNWSTLNQKVFRRLGFLLEKEEYLAITNGQPGCIERVLKLVRLRIAEKGSSLPRALSRGPSTASAVQDPRGSLSGPQKPLSPGCHSPVAQSWNTDRGSLGEGMTQHTPGVNPGMHGDSSISSMAELQQANQILTSKVMKLEELLKLKEARIEALLA
eukprot:jgi/Botrbrau1/3423/Bobra.139_1s0004.1